MLKKCFIFLSIFFFSSTVILSQYQFDQIKFNPIKEGLPKRGVWTMVEDTDGFMWFGTDGAGLFRFDGSSYEQFLYESDDSTSISGNFIYSSLVDDKNRLWLGTNRGLNLFDSQLKTFKRIIPLDKASPNDIFKIECIFQLDEDHLLLGTIHYGAIKYNIKTGEASSALMKDFTGPVKVKNFIKFNNSIYGLSSKGLIAYDEEKNDFKLATFPTESGLRSSGFPMECGTIDADNNLWLGTEETGLVKIAQEGKLFSIKQHQFTQKRVMTIFVTKEQQIFCGTENDGLFFIEKDENQESGFSFKQFHKDVLNSSSIWSSFQDSQNRIWMGTFNKGVFVYDQLSVKFTAIENLMNTNSLEERAVSTVIADNIGKIWVGIDGGGICVYDPENKEKQSINTVVESEYKGLTSNSVIELFLDKKGNIWVGTWESGIYFLKKGTKRFINYTKASTNGELTSNRIHCFSEDSKGRIWIGTFERGLSFYDPVTNKFQHCNSKALVDLGIANDQIRYVEVDSKDNVWLGSDFGLFKVTIDESPTGELSFTAISLREPMLKESGNNTSIGNISSIHLAKNHQVLVGTEGAGLFIISEDGTVKQYENKNYQEKIIGSIIDGMDENTFWIDGAHGIASIQLDSDDVVIYDKNDGFISNYFYYINAICSSSDGTIYYGSKTNLNYFKPNEIMFNKVPPKLHFKNFKIYNKKITPFQEDSPLSKDISKTKELTLDYSQRVFSIEYVGINFTRSEKNQYAYQLEGVDPTWRYVGDIRNAIYTNLKPGNYTFRVKATNNDNVWTPEPLELEIKILPAWWASNLAYLCYFLLFLFFLYFLNNFYRNRLEANQSIQIERQKRKQEEQLSLQKEEFFTNISHEFRTPLTLIINPLEDIINDKNNVLPEEIKRKAEIAYKNSSRLNRLINQLMDFRKIQSDKMILQVEKIEVVSQVREILDYFKEDAIARNINLVLEPHVNTLIVWLDVSMLEKIIFNLLSNAFKVTPNGGAIIVSISENLIPFPNSEFKQPKEGFEICVSDNGGGLTQNEISQIFQRFSQINRDINTHYGGTGIGLEVVKKMTHLHRGNVDVTSKVGKGSNFKVSFLLGREHFKFEEILHRENYSQENGQLASLPLRQTPAVKEDIQKEEKIKPSKDQKDRPIILVVEDNLELGSYLKSKLEEDYNILIAENGQSGFDIAVKETPHIILTDVMMPVMDGYTFCKKIKEEIKTSHIPVIMLTARAMTEDKIAGIDIGADAYLTKPLDTGLLKSTIKQLLSSRQILIDKFSSNGKVRINEKTTRKITAVDNVFIKKMVDYIQENINDSSLTVESVAKYFFLSRSQLYRKTKSLTGMTVNEMIRKIRLKKAREMVRAKDGNISEIAYKVGFSSPSYFAKCFKDEFGKLPTEIE